MIHIMGFYRNKADPDITAVPFEVDAERVLCTLIDHGVIETVEIPVAVFEADFTLETKGETQ